MRLLAAITALFLAALVSAQDANITVGVPAGTAGPGGDDQFSPSTITAKNGSVITFTWKSTPGNHSVTQSAFNNPCTPVSGGFDAGWVFTPSTALSESPQWRLTITDDSKPIWFFCKNMQGHCKKGMVGAINAPASGSNTYAAFLANAMAFSGTSGQGQGGLVGLGASASGYPTPIPSGATNYIGPTPTATTPAATSKASSSGAAASATASKPNSAATRHAGSVVALLATVFGLVLA